MRFEVMPTWVATEFKPSKVRLFNVYTELLLALGVIYKLDLVVDIERRNSQVGKIE